MAALSLAANKLRSFLSMIGIVFGIMAVIIIICLGQGAKKEILRQIEMLGIHNIYIRPVSVDETLEKNERDMSSGIEIEDIHMISTVSESIRACAAVVEIPSVVINEIQEISHQIVSVTPSFFDILDVKLSAGRRLLDRDVKERHLTAVLGHDTARALGNKASPGKFIRLGNHLFQIVGILAPFSGKKARSTAISTRNLDELIITPLGSEKWISGPGRQTGSKDSFFVPSVSEVIVQTASAGQVAGIADRIKRALDKKYGNQQNYQIVTPYALLNRSRQTGDMFNLFLLSIASVSLLVGGIGIMNIMLATVSERKKEIGIRRSVGAKKQDIMIQFLTESILLTTAGGAAGILLGVVCVMIIGKLSPWPVTLTPVSILLPFVIASVTGVCSGSYPALKASRIDPLDALYGL